MSVKSRREEYAEATRTAIVEAAIGRFAVEGFARTSIDSIAEAARVTKGGIYHHFRDKAELFEAAFVAMEDRLLANVEAATRGFDDPWQLVEAGVDVYLAECCQADFRRIALEDAPVALGWARWKQIEERYFLGLIETALDALASQGLIEIPRGDLTARMFLGALAEAGLAIAAAANPRHERDRARQLAMRILRGFSELASPGSNPAAEPPR
jgi:AcrR family transcriptional regulator